MTSKQVIGGACLALVLVVGFGCWKVFAPTEQDIDVEDAPSAPQPLEAHPRAPPQAPLEGRTLAAHVRVRSEGSGLPILGATLRAADGSASVGTSDESGLLRTRVTVDAASAGAYLVGAESHEEVHIEKTWDSRAAELDLGVVSLPATPLVGGLVQSETGTPVAGARVELRRADGTGGSTVVDSTVTSDVGTFSLRWSSKQQRYDGVDALVAEDATGARGVLDEPLLGAKSNVVVLHPADGRLLARVHPWPEGASPEAELVLQLRASRAGRSEAGRPWIEPTTSIRIRRGVDPSAVALPSGRYSASATGRGLVWSGSGVTIVSGQTVSLTIAPQVVADDPVRHVEVRVVCDEDGKPVANAILRGADAGGSSFGGWPTTDASGRAILEYVHVPGLVPPYSVFGQHAELEERSVPIVDPAHPPTDEIELRLPRRQHADVLRFWIDDGGGRALLDASVWFADAQGDLVNDVGMKSAFADATHVLERPSERNPMPGATSICVRRHGYEDVDLDLERALAVATGSLPASISLRPASRLSVHVVDAGDGSPLSGARVGLWLRGLAYAVSQSPRTVAESAVTDPKGSAELFVSAPRRPGIVEVRRIGFTTQVVSIAPQSTSIEIRLRATPIRVEGEIRGRGAPVEGATVQLVAPGLPPKLGSLFFRQTRTRSDGRYSITEVPSGVRLEIKAFKTGPGGPRDRIAATIALGELDATRTVDLDLR